MVRGVNMAKKRYEWTEEEYQKAQEKLSLITGLVMGIILVAMGVWLLLM